MPASLPSERLVVFLDILGFRGLVERMFDGDAELYERVLEELRSIQKAESGFFSSVLRRLRPPNSNLPLPPAPKVEMLAFSDSIVLTGAPDPRAVRLVLREAGGLVLGLLRQGIPVRGGAVIAPCHFEAGIIFGPAMIAAYDLEHKEALFPRLLLSAPVVEVLDQEESFPVRVREDSEDGGLFLDVLELLEGTRGSPERQRALAEIGGLVDSLIRDAEGTRDEQERRKRLARLSWLRGQVRRSIEENR